MTGKIKMTFEPTTIKYSPASFDLEVENEEEFMKKRTDICLSYYVT